MIHLLDANLLIALSDSNHVHHEVAHHWFSRKCQRGWATCPLTENAFIRILGKVTYPKSPGSTKSALYLLRHRCSQAGHHFWADNLSLRQKDVWKESEGVASSHVPDCYLLALAVHYEGKLATLDRRIPAHVISNGPEHLVLVG